MSLLSANAGGLRSISAVDCELVTVLRQARPCQILCHGVGAIVNAFDFSDLNGAVCNFLL